jgi:type I restriction enzyme M protein
MAERRTNNGATLGFEQTLWQAADKMRGYMDPSEYKHVALGLIFLKYISDAFEERRKEIGKQATYKVHGESSRNIRGSKADME